MVSSARVVILVWSLPLLAVASIQQPWNDPAQYNGNCFTHVGPCSNEGWSPPMPDNDPFYIPPSGWESLELGALIRSRPIELADFGILNKTACQAFDVFYRTSYGNDSAATTGAAIIIPLNATQDRPQLVSYQIAEDASTTLCQPSYTVRRNAQGNNIGNQLELIFINYLLEEGYTVILPDYELPASQFGIGLTAAHGVLDSIRATLQFTPAVAHPQNATYAIMGYSGGAIAASYAAQEQPRYAPDLTNFVGAAFGGLPANWTLTIETINNGVLTASVIATIWSEMAAWPELSEFLMPYLNASSYSFLSQVNNHCLSGNMPIFSGLDAFAYFDGLTQDEILHSSAWQNTVGRDVLNRPGDPVPTIPLYLWKSGNDTAIGPVQDEVYYNQLCAKNVSSLHYDFNTYGTHEDGLIIGFQDAIGFLRQRFAGEEKVRGCLKTYKNETRLDPTFLARYPEALNEDLEGLLAAFG